MELRCRRIDCSPCRSPPAARRPPCGSSSHKQNRANATVVVCRRWAAAVLSPMFNEVSIGFLWRMVMARRSVGVVGAIALAISVMAVPLSGQVLSVEGQPVAPAIVATDGVFNAAQVVGQPAGPVPTPRHTGIRALMKDLVSDVQHLPSKENLFWAGVGGGLALAAHPADDNVNTSLVNSDF